MAFTRSRMGIFWSLPPDNQDWANLNTSGVRLVMLPYRVATPDLLAHLQDAHKRVVIRMTNEDACTVPPGSVRFLLEDYVRRGFPVEAVILGNEPERSYDTCYGSPDWGLGYDGAWTHANRADAYRRTLQGIGGIKVIAPAFSRGAISEDDAPHPGQESWAEVCRAVYDACDGQGFHLYQYAWKSPVDSLRLRFALQRGEERHHRNLWIDELGIDTGTPVERMAAYIDVARLLERHPYGERVEFLCFFVSNGDGQGWGKNYIIRDRQAYKLLGSFMAGN